MKLILFLTVSLILQVNASSFGQKITISSQNAVLIDVLSDIRAQSGYDFIFTAEMLKLSKKVNIDVAGKDLKVVLDQIFKDQPLTYTIDDKAVIISIKKNAVGDRRATLSMLTAHGRVTDEQGFPIAGALVKTKDGTRVATTQSEGYFWLRNIDEKAEIVISFIGFESKSVAAATELGTIVLKSITSKLDEVQIIGYGTTTRRLSTGSIATVKTEDIQKQPVNDILQALQGRVSGMEISPSSGVTGAAPTVRIRGINSLAAGTSPLYIVDGIPVPETQSSISSTPLDSKPLSNLLGLNPADIAEVSVLKDADATSIYGSRGANGVVLITTKKGTKNGTSVNLNAYTGIQQVGHFAEMFDIHQYNAMRREALTNDGIAITPTTAPDLLTWDTVNVHDWQKELIGETSVNHSVNASISGGNAYTQFYVNAGYYKTGSVTPSNTDFTRKTFRANITHQSINKRFNLDASSAYNISDLVLPTNSMVSFINLPPSYPVFNANGTLNFDNSRGNPFGLLRQTFSSPSRNYSGNVNLSYGFVKGLQIKLNAGYNNIITEQSLIQPLTSLASTATSGQLRVANNTSSTWIAEPQASYSLVVGKHNIQLLAGTTFQRTRNTQLSVNGTNYISDALLDDIGAAGTKTVTSTSSQYSYTSFFGRATYNFNERYLANVSYRRDGSSRFGPGRRFGNFGSMGMGWIFSEENWLKKFDPVLSFGKLRTSYGISGNDQIADYGYLASYTNQTSTATIYDGLTLAGSRIANPEYRWEENRKFEAALDLGFFKNRILLTTSFFRNQSSNQLISYAISPQAGFPGYQANFPAIVQNQGWELNLNTRNLTGSFSWQTNINLSKSNNKLVRFDNIENSSYFSIYEVGQSLSLLKAYTLQGLSSTGVPIFEDKNGDGTINFLDATNNLNNNPLFGGISNEFSYKNFSFSFFMEYTKQNNFSNLITGSIVGGIGTNQTTFMLDRWRRPGDEANTIMPRYTTLSSTYRALQYLQSDAWFETTHIFRLSNVSLAYQVPADLLKHVSIKKLQVYMNAQNLYVFDKYKKYRLDPLTGNSAIPPLQTFVFGFNCSF